MKPPVEIKATESGIRNVAVTRARINARVRSASISPLQDDCTIEAAFFRATADLATYPAEFRTAVGELRTTDEELQADDDELRVAERALQAHDDEPCRTNRLRGEGGDSLEQAALDAVTAEQRRIGRELHDNIGQELTGLAIEAGTLLDSLRTEGHAEAATARKIYDAVRRTLGLVRALSQGLIPVEFEEGDLASALAALVDRLPKPPGCRVRFSGNHPAPVRHRSAAAQIYRIAQEAITNALKHSRARNIEVSLTTDRRRMVLRVADDGIGFDEPRSDAGLGIAGMRYRAGLIKAALSIGRRDEGGTVVTCTLDDKQVI